MDGRVAPPRLAASVELYEDPLRMQGPEPEHDLARAPLAKRLQELAASHKYHGDVPDRVCQDHHIYCKGHDFRRHAGLRMWVALETRGRSPTRKGLPLARHVKRW